MWICKKCNEEIEDNFDSCWKCTKDIDIIENKKTNLDDEIEEKEKTPFFKTILLWINFSNTIDGSTFFYRSIKISIPIIITWFISFLTIDTPSGGVFFMLFYFTLLISILFLMSIFHKRVKSFLNFSSLLVTNIVSLFCIWGIIYISMLFTDFYRNTYQSEDVFKEIFDFLPDNIIILIFYILLVIMDSQPIKKPNHLG